MKPNKYIISGLVIILSILFLGPTVAYAEEIIEIATGDNDSVFEDKTTKYCLWSAKNILCYSALGAAIGPIIGYGLAAIYGVPAMPVVALLLANGVQSGMYAGAALSVYDICTGTGGLDHFPYLGVAIWTLSAISILSGYGFINETLFATAAAVTSHQFLYNILLTNSDGAVVMLLKNLILISSYAGIGGAALGSTLGTVLGTPGAGLVYQQPLVASLNYSLLIHCWIGVKMSAYGTGKELLIYLVSGGTVSTLATSFFCSSAQVFIKKFNQIREYASTLSDSNSSIPNALSFNSQMAAPENWWGMVLDETLIKYYKLIIYIIQLIIKTFFGC